jgi:hypothetical protein
MQSPTERDRGQDQDQDQVPDVPRTPRHKTAKFSSMPMPMPMPTTRVGDGLDVVFKRHGRLLI